jgi:hypothetical protein
MPRAPKRHTETILCRRMLLFPIAAVFNSSEVGQLVGRSVGWSVGRPVSQSVGWLVGRSVGQLVGQLVSRLVGRLVGQSVGRSVVQLVGRLVGQAYRRFPSKRNITKQ